jgi:hypothetical protein
MKRSVQPEILDSLPEDHPDALANRRDLRLINFLMGAHRWFRRTLIPLLRPSDRILELGAGAGHLGLSLRLAAPGRARRYSGLDRWTRPAEWPEEWSWIQADLLEFDRYADYTVVLANLILHQFEDEKLRRLRGRLVHRRLRLFLASEPARRRLHQRQLALIGRLALHPVSRHDARVSVAAGFRERELPELLGLGEPGWRVRSACGFFGWNRTVAVRAEGGGR